MTAARVAVIRFPGVNCEAETALALDRVGLSPEIFLWTQPASRLRDYQAYVLPGGFSYQDRVRAGALAAKDPLVDVLAGEAERGKPVLGICNGAQVLVEAGLVPGGAGVELALARNHMPDRTGYYARWVTTKVESSPCVFTRHLEPGTLLPLPVAHGEGRFTSRETGRVEALARAGQVPLCYATRDGAAARVFPANPNGAEAAAAAVCNGQGNVLALMPHPERAQVAGALPAAVTGTWAGAREASRARGDLDAPGPGLALFEGLKRHLEEA